MKDWLFAREVCRCLGFTVDELFFAVAPSGDLIDVSGKRVHHDHPVIAVEIRRGGISFRWIIGPIDMAVDELEPAYRAACDAWNNGDVANREEFLASLPVRQAPHLLLALEAKGVSIGHMS